MGKKTVTVLGATGAQGGGVVRALLDQQDWQVRALTRNPRSPCGTAPGRVGL